MALARWQRTIVDGEGNVLPGALVTVRKELPGAALATLYTDRAGAVSAGNPVTADANGLAAFHVIGGVYRIDAVLGGYSVTWRYVGIGTSSEHDFGALGTVQGAWDSGTTYDAGDIVEHGGFNFASIAGSNLNHEPDDATPASDTYWTLLGGTQGPAGSSDVVGTSTTSLAIGIGSKGFTVVESDRGWAVGARLRASSDANPAVNWMEGVVTAYSGTSLTVLVDLVGGSGTLADWTINLAGERGAAGTDQGRPFTYKSETADADPGAGCLRLNHATHASATSVFADNADAAGTDVTAWLDAMDDVDNAGARGVLLIVKSGNAAIWRRYNVTGVVTDGTGYRKVAVAYVAGAGSLSADDAIVVHFVPAGADGADGGGLADVVDDTTPQLGGDLDLNGNQITSPDGTDQIDIPNGSIDLKTASTSRLDITDAGVRLGAGNARVTTVLDEDNMASDSAAALATQQSIKAYADLKAAKASNLSDLANAATAFGNIKQAATTSATGVVEKATDAEVRAATADKYLAADHIETASAPVALSDAAPVAVDWDAGVNFSLTVTANRQIDNPTNEVPGTWRTITVQGNNTTDRTITFGAEFLGEVPVITDCDSGIWYLITIYCVAPSHFTASAKKVKG